jgi:uncharacterized damage-inducible protein DinB
MSTTIETFLPSYKFYRARTLGLLDNIEKLPDPQAALAWRPGPGRAHLAWQLMHIGVTEDIFASERLAPHKQGRFTELWPRFRGGSKPDDNVPTPAVIRQTLEQSRADLLTTLADYTEDRLTEIPAALKERGLTVQDVLYLLGWHEAHHQGQAHATLNSYKASMTQSPAS